MNPSSLEEGEVALARLHLQPGDLGAREPRRPHPRALQRVLLLPPLLLLLPLPLPLTQLRAAAFSELELLPVAEPSVEFAGITVETGCNVAICPFYVCGL